MNNFNSNAQISNLILKIQYSFYEIYFLYFIISHDILMPEAQVHLPCDRVNIFFLPPTIKSWWLICAITQTNRRG